jgi:predicted ATPase
VLRLLEHRFGGNGVYLMDEPEAALSPQRQMVLLGHIRRLIDAGSQFVICTHSPIVMAYPDAQLMEISEDGICPTVYDDLTHIAIYRRFLGNRNAMLSTLFEN